MKPEKNTCQKVFIINMAPQLGLEPRTP